MVQSINLLRIRAIPMAYSIDTISCITERFMVYLVEIKNIILSAEGHGLIYFKRHFHPVMLEMKTAI